MARFDYTHLLYDEESYYVCQCKNYDNYDQLTDRQPAKCEILNISKALKV